MDLATDGEKSSPGSFMLTSSLSRLPLGWSCGGWRLQTLILLRLQQKHKFLFSVVISEALQVLFSWCPLGPDPIHESDSVNRIIECICWPSSDHVATHPYNWMGKGARVAWAEVVEGWFLKKCHGVVTSSSRNECWTGHCSPLVF